MMRWFGHDWGAAVNRIFKRADEVPVGSTCIFCGRLIEPNDEGVYFMQHEGPGWIEKPSHVKCAIQALQGNGKN